MSLSRLGDRNDLIGVSKISGDLVRSWCKGVLGRGVGERDVVARPFPLELIRGGERERLRILRPLSFADARDRNTGWTLESSATAALYGLVDLRVSSSRWRARGCGLCPRRRILSRPFERERDRRRPGDREREGPGSQRRVRSNDGGGCIPCGVSYFTQRGCQESAPSLVAIERTCTTESYTMRSLYGDRK